MSDADLALALVCGGFVLAALLGVMVFYVVFYPLYRDRRRP